MVALIAVGSGTNAENFKPVPGPALKLMIIIMLPILTIAPPIVFLRRSIVANRSPERNLWKQLISPPLNDHARCLKYFGLLTLVPLVLAVNGLLGFYGIFPLIIRDLIVVTASPFYVLGFVVLYLNYTKERSSVHAKLVGLSLVTTLLALMVVNTLQYSPDRLSQNLEQPTLSEQSIIFQPSADGGYHVHRSESSQNTSNEQPSRPINVNKSFVELEFEFPFYNQKWRSVYVADNGFLAFDHKPNIKSNFPFRKAPAANVLYSNTPRIIPFYMDPGLYQEGSVSYQTTADSATFTWQNFQYRADTEPTSFQAQLHSNGDIQFTYHHTHPKTEVNVIGLTPGGTVSDISLFELFNATEPASPAGSAMLDHLTLQYRDHVHKELLQFVLIVLIVTFIIILGFPFFYRMALTQPIRRLLEGLQRVDHGNLDTKLNVMTEDELGELTRHFNRMTVSLKQNKQLLMDNASDLEQRVQLRTEELARQNLKLEKQSIRLKEIDQSKSLFFTNLSHEFRTPLTLTLGPLEDLSSGLHGPQTPQVLEQLELAMRNSRQVLNLVNQLLDIAKVEANQLSLEIKRIDLNELLIELGQRFTPLAERKQIRFELELHEQALWLDCDPNQLEKVFTNLLSNAFKFTPDRGAIRLLTTYTDASEQTEASLIVTLTDNGIGIPKNQLQHVFERFYQATPAAQAKYPGTGIGLALVKELVELHHGQITVKSELDFGTCFTVSLPALSSHEALISNSKKLENDNIQAPLFGTTDLYADDLSAQIQAQQNPNDESLELKQDDRTCVLVVDDNSEIRSYISKHLMSHYRVEHANDGQIGLDMANNLLPDLIVSDVMMPNMDGSDLCKAIKSDPKLNYIPIILLTAKATETDKLEGLELGADDYLCKPFSIAELQARISNLIKSRRQLEARYKQPIELEVSHIEVDSADQSFLKRLQYAIEKQLDDPDFGVEQLAKTLGQSRGNLHRRLRTLLNQTPSEIIRNIRLQRSADLLSQHAGSISEIAYTVGFKGVAHFSTSFRNKYGVTPSAYSANH